MKKFTLEYRETYACEYEIEANSYEEAEKELRYLIQEGKYEGPDECIDSGFKVIAVEEV